MPAIPLPILNSVVYLYPTRSAAESGHGAGGTGFLVAVKGARDAPAHIYVVTNYHVAVSPRNGPPSTVIRVNSTDGRTSIFDQFDAADFEFLPGGGDVAAIKLPLDGNIHRYNPIGLGNFVTEEQGRDKVSVGEDVFMVGRFIDHDGGLTNKPAVRFGSISIEPTYHPDMPNSDRNAHYYCLDMHSRSGSSGSQVWTYRTMGSNLNDAIEGLKPELHPPMVGLLGIHSSQFIERLTTPDGTEVTGWSGMTAALPAWRMMLPPYSRPRPIRNKAPGPSLAPGAPGRPSAA